MKIKDKEEENISLRYLTYTLEYKGFEVLVERKREFSDEIGEMEDEINILRSDRELNEDEVEEITEFICDEE